MKLQLKRETLGELSPAELDAIVGGTVSLNSCSPIVCIRTVEGCVNTIDNCINTIDGCVNTIDRCVRTVLSCIVC